MGGIYASSGCAWMALEEEEACTRRCIAELYAAVLELLLQDFWEGGLRLSAPPPPVPALLTRPGPRLGLVSHSLRGGWVPSTPAPNGSISALTLPRVACTVRHHGGHFLYVRARGVGPDPSHALS